MRIEEAHSDVLQNIEFAVAHLYRQHPQMTDYEVLRTYEALSEVYVAERIGRQALASDRSAVEAELIEAAYAMCEWRLGRGAGVAEQETDGPLEPIDPIDVETLLLCLKRLRKSVNMWTKQGGRQGYLRFMSQYVR